MNGLESPTNDAPICTVVRHVEIEDLGFLEGGLRSADLSFEYLDAGLLADDAPATLPGGLIVLGGPMGGYELDRYPFLAAEIAPIRRQLEEGLPVIGICLGAQLLAAGGAARVYPGRHGKEIGWAEVELTAAAVGDPLWVDFPRRFTTFHWHGDSFDVPAGADVLAHSQRYVQAFRVGPRAYGVQFHPEVVPEALTSWIRAHRLELEAERLSSRDVLDVPDAAAHRTLALTLGRNIARLITTGRPKSSVTRTDPLTS